MSAAVPALAGAILLLILIFLALRVVWLLCNGKQACAAQRAHVPTDDQIEVEVICKAINAQPVMFCNEHGMFTINERGEWVPFEGSN